MKKRYYFLSILILFLINIGVVNADSFTAEEYYAQLYDNNNGILTTVTTNFESLGDGASFHYGFVNLVANSSGGAWGFSAPIPIVNGHTYALTLPVYTPDCGYIRKSTYNNVGLGTDLSSAATSYQNNTNAEEISSDYNNYHNLQYVFTARTNASYIIIPFSTSASGTLCEVQLQNFVINDLGNSGVSSTEINNALSSQTNEINNTISNQTSIIQDSITQSEENITNSINDGFEQAFGVCPKNLISDITFTSGYKFDKEGNLISANAYYTKDYIPLDSSILTLSGFNNDYNLNGNLILYDSNKNFIDYFYVANRTINIPSNAKYFRFSSYTNTNMIICTKNSCTCENKLDSLNDTQKETNEKLDDLNDNITDSDSSEASGEAENFFNNFNTNTFGLTSVITAPLELIKSVTSKSCNPLQLTTPFVEYKQFNLPCLSSIYENHFGSFLTIYRTITFGFVSYWVCIKIFNLVKDFKNPEHDEIEVLDL